jgi:hypothetical protein
VLCSTEATTHSVEIVIARRCSTSSSTGFRLCQKVDASA